MKILLIYLLLFLSVMVKSQDTLKPIYSVTIADTYICNIILDSLLYTGKNCICEVPLLKGEYSLYKGRVFGVELRRDTSVYTTNELSNVHYFIKHNHRVETAFLTTGILYRVGLSNSTNKEFLEISYPIDSVAKLNIPLGSGYFLGIFECCKPSFLNTIVTPINSLLPPKKRIRFKKPCKALPQEQTFFYHFLKQNKFI
jgi:hypothetical protein